MWNTRNEDTLYIKNKWEQEAGTLISDEDSERVCIFQWTSTNSLVWREHCWKDTIGFIKTPYQGKYKQVNAECWRKCGSQETNHFHIFWGCPILHNFWSGIHKALKYVFNVQITFDFINLYMGLVIKLERSRDIKLLEAFLAASKKCIARKWLNPTPPS